MGVLIVICSLILAAVVVMVISSPLRASARQGTAESTAAEAAGRVAAVADRDELEAAREAKYREIRDAELDYRTGKLSSADYRANNDQLRLAALAILDEIEALPGPTDEDEGESDAD